MRMTAIADTSILRACSTLGLGWILGRLFRQVLVAPSADFKLACTSCVQAELSPHELHRAMRLRGTEIWRGTGCRRYTRYGLPADTAECFSIAEVRDIPVLTESEAARAYNDASGKLQLLNSDEIIEWAAQQGILGDRKYRSY